MSAGLSVLSGASTAERHVLTRGFFPAVNNTSATNTACLENRTRHVIAEDTPYLTCVDTGVYVTSLNVETNIGNDQTIERSLEIPSIQSTPVRWTWGGLNVGTITDGVGQIASDQLSASSFGLSVFRAGTVVWLRQRKTVTVGQKISTWQYGGAATGYSGEGAFWSDGNSASQVMNSGAMTTPTGGSTSTFSAFPVVVLGAPGRCTSTVLLGDSLGMGQADNWSDGSSGGGWFARGMYNVNGRPLAHANFSHGTTCANQYVANSTIRKTYYPYFTRSVIHWGTNDAALSFSLTNTKNSMQTIASQLKAGGLRYVSVSGILPRTDGTNTPSTLYANGGTFRDPFNSYFASLASPGTDIDEFFNVSTAICDPVNTDKWGSVSYTPDFVHVNATSSALCATNFNAVAAAWRLP